MAPRYAAIALAAATLVGAVSLTACSREQQVEAAYPPQGQFVTVDGVRLHAVVSGRGPDLVLIHGASGSLRDFTFSLMPRLARDYRVIAIDRPGLGWSAPAEGAEKLAVQATLLRDAARQLGADRPLVLGQSYGGAVALSWALTHPQSLAGLITVSAPSHPWDTGLPPLYRVTSNPVGQAVAVPLISAMVPDGYLSDAITNVFAPQTPPEGYLEHFGPRMSARPMALRANAVQRRALKSQIRAMSPQYGRITAPVEIVHGTADGIVGFKIHAEPLARDLPNARLTALPGIGHMPHHVAQDQVVAAIHRAAARAGLR